MKVIADQTYKTQKIVDGLKNNYELVKNHGIDATLLSKLESDNSYVKTQNEEIEKLQVEVRAKSKQANIRLMEVKNQVKFIKRVIKQNFDQSQWKEFGITDKR